jgi:hypothetical protein
MPTSSEATYGRKLAFYYKHRNLLQHSRADRVAAVKKEVAEFEDAIKSDQATHETHCEACRERRPCFKEFQLSPHHEAISERLTLLAKEEAGTRRMPKRHVTGVPKTIATASPLTGKTCAFDGSRWQILSARTVGPQRRNYTTSTTTPTVFSPPHPSSEQRFLKLKATETY